MPDETSPITACDNAIAAYKQAVEDFDESAERHRRNMEDAKASARSTRLILIEWEHAKALLTDGDPVPVPVVRDVVHQKSEGCWCGAHIEAIGDEESVLAACNDFRLNHTHRLEDGWG
jgi:hypothetical protein